MTRSIKLDVRIDIEDGGAESEVKVVMYSVYVPLNPALREAIRYAIKQTVEPLISLALEPIKGTNT